jgi:hypothetical protein
MAMVVCVDVHNEINTAGLFVKSLLYERLHIWFGTNQLPTCP